jgi:hypothetical protein
MRIKKSRAAHMHSMAEYMAEHAEKYKLPPKRMYILGYLHDIGYLFGDKCHELTGSSYMDMLGYVDADIIRFHGSSPQDYISYKRCEEEDIPKELILLWEADLMIDVDGKEVGFSERLKGIKERRGEQTYKIAQERANWLITRGYGRW